ncbi:MAG: amidohydrolase family protein [Planctomycetes bacterium]|nr:amidohydrolase family protein [Planctomycetota bacterium]
MILRAKYLIVNPTTIIKDGAVVIKNTRIQHVGPASLILSQKQKYLDLGNVILTPGLINPHTHLEGPELYGGTPPPGEEKLKPPQHFLSWAQKVIKIRLRMKKRDFINIVKHGYEISTRNGVTTVGDHTRVDRTWAAHHQAVIRRALLEEVVNLDSLTANKNIATVKRSLKKIPANNSIYIRGLAPHAPYSVSATLYQQLFALARKMKIPMSTHLSELKEEIELLKKGTGGMIIYLKKIGRYSPFWFYPKMSPVEYMAQLGILKPPTFLVHCNYLSNHDIKLIARSGCSVIFCPKSQHYFGHKNHPFRRLVKSKVNVALGTDGLGSNSNLSILEEMRFIYKNYTGVAPAMLWRMGTINGAQALGLQKKLGVLKPGYEADLAAFPLKRKISSRTQILPTLIKTAPESVMVMVAGKIVYPVRK